MDSSISLDLIAELSEAERAEVRALAQAVYPPEEAADWPGRHLEWAEHEWCVRARENEGELVSYVGVVLQEGTYNQQAVLVGGVGGIKTHPAARRRGHAERGLRRATDFFREVTAADFALLVCREELLSYYARLGWEAFGGKLWVRQHGQRAEFTFNRVMTLGIASERPVDGTIDLHGPPW